MTAPHRRALAAAALAITGCVLLAACGSSAPAAQTGAPAVPATASVTPNVSVAPTDPASTDPASTAPTPAADPSSGGTACTLVTEQEVAAVLGKDPGPGSPFTSHGASQCQYGSFQTAFVLVNLNPSQGKPFYDHAHSDQKLSQAGTVSDVAGVGDRAFGIFGHGTASIYFNKGDALVLVMVAIRTASVPPKAQAVALATTAAGRV